MIMKQLIVIVFLLSCCLVIYSEPTDNDDGTKSIDYESEESCALFGGICAKKCKQGETKMNDNENKLCDLHSKGLTTCCNKANKSRQCKSQAGQCEKQCHAKIIKDQDDCTSLGRQCCVYLF